MSDPIRVLIADDHPLIRQGLEIVIDEQPDMELVAQAVDGLDAVAKVLETQPDVVLMDLKMPKQDGLTALRQILEALPATNGIILTSFTDDAQVLDAVAAGAKGFLNKDSHHEELLGAIRAVSRCDAALHPAAARVLMQSYKATLQPEAERTLLTQMELRVLQLLCPRVRNPLHSASARANERPSEAGTNDRINNPAIPLALWGRGRGNAAAGALGLRADQAR